MSTQHPPAIAKVVAHHGGPTALSRHLDGKPTYQEIANWVRRGWASPMHFLRLEPLLPDGVTVRDLYADRDAAAKVPA